MKNKLKKIIAGIVTFAVLGVTSAVPAFAADKTDTGTGSITDVTINGSISPLTISVTHPINVAYAISPDAETFTAPDIISNQQHQSCGDRHGGIPESRFGRNAYLQRR